MHFEVETPLLKQALSIVGRAVNYKSPIKAFHCVLFEFAKNTLTLTTSDLESSYSVTMQVCESLIDNGDGRACLPAKTLTEIVSKLPGAPVSISLDEKAEQCNLKCGRSRYQLPTQDPDEFPGALNLDRDEPRSLDPRTMATMINAVSFLPADISETRAAMSGIRVAMNGGKLQLVATDGRRMGYVEADAPELPDGVFLAPAEHMRSLARLIKDAKQDQTMEWWLDHSMLCFQFRNVTFSFRLLEGVFPNVDKVRPTAEAFSRSVRIARESLAGAIGRMLVVAQEKQSPNLILFEFGSGQVKLSAQTPGVGEAEELVPCVVTGPELSICFNGSYLLDFVRALSSEEIEIHLQDEHRSAMVCSFGGSGNVGGDVCDILIQYVIMPVKMQEVVEVTETDGYQKYPMKGNL